MDDASSDSKDKGDDLPTSQLFIKVENKAQQLSGNKRKHQQIDQWMFLMLNDVLHHLITQRTQ